MDDNQVYDAARMSYVSKDIPGELRHGVNCIPACGVPLSDSSRSGFCPAEYLTPPLAKFLRMGLTNDALVVNAVAKHICRRLGCEFRASCPRGRQEPDSLLLSIQISSYLRIYARPAGKGCL